MLTVITVVITLLYPLVIWFGHGHIEPKWLAALLLLAAASRLFSIKISRLARWLVVGVFILAGFTVWSNALLPLKLYPVLINVGMLIAFAYSLIFPPSMVEFFARLTEPDLPLVAVAYTRRVTQIWCGFFVINGAIALVTAIWMTDAIWSLYTGVISYVLMGLLFGTEYLFRLRFKRLNHV